MSYFNIPEPPLEPPEYEDQIVYTCVLCDEHVYVGEEYYDIPGLGICCASCIDDARHHEAELPEPDPDAAYDAARDEGRLP